jgi:NADH-quinone oxidoreductase subunit H
MEFMLALGLIAVKVALLIAMLLLLPMPLTWLERKIAGHMQQRMGPMRVGWHGLLQPLADGIKLLTKEDHIPTEADRFLFKLAPILALAPPFVVFVAIPFGETISVRNAEITLYLSNMNVALLFVLAVIGLEVFGVIFGGWAANSKYAVLGSLRTCAQMISYEIPMGFAVIGVVMLAQSMSLLDIVHAQTRV